MAGAGSLLEPSYLASSENPTDKPVSENDQQVAGWLAAQSQNIYPPNFISQSLLALNGDLQLSDRIRQTSFFLNISNMLKRVHGAEKQPSDSTREIKA